MPKSAQLYNEDLLSLMLLSLFDPIFVVFAIVYIGSSSRLLANNLACIIAAPVLKNLSLDHDWLLP